MILLRDRGNALTWLAAALYAWISAWWSLAGDWSLDERYQFGWGVPFLFFWMIWRRWDGPVSPTSGAGPWMMAACGWMLLALGEIMRWKDPIWRMTGASLALGAVFVTCGCFYRLGGIALLKRQAFALAFSWFAVPWPVSLDQGITLRLLRFVTGLNTALLSAASIPALQRGNVIELRNGLVGVEEACSGICSLQASLFASVFLGEYFRLSAIRRWALMVLGLLTCMAANCLRVFSLTLLVVRWNGIVAEKWHDVLGGTATVLSFSCLGLVAYKLTAKGWDDAPELRSFQWPILRGYDGGLVFTCLVILPIAGWALFHSAGESQGRERSRWVLDYRDLPSGWNAAAVEPPPAATASLHFTKWESCQLRSMEGWSAQVTHLFWKAGDRIPGTAFFHTPALCLSGVGWRSESNVETWILDHHGRKLTVAAYRLASPENQSLVAIQSLSMNGNPDGFLTDIHRPSDSWRRFALLWSAPSHRIDEEFLAYMPDLGSPALQREAFSNVLNLTLVPNTSN